MDKRKFALLGVGIFLAGCLAGGLGTGAALKYVFNPAVRLEKHGFAAFYMDRMEQVLKLSAEQKSRIQPILDDMMDQIRQAKAPCREAEDRAMAAGQERIAQELDAVQAEKYKALNERFDRRRKALFKH